MYPILVLPLLAIFLMMSLIRQVTTHLIHQIILLILIQQIMLPINKVNHPILPIILHILRPLVPCILRPHQILNMNITIRRRGQGQATPA